MYGVLTIGDSDTDSADLLKKYQTELDRRSLGTLMYRLDQKGYVNVDVSTRVNLYTAKVKEEEARKRREEKS